MSGPFINLRYLILKIGFFFYRVILVISLVLRETTLTISDSTGETVSLQYEIVKVVSFSTTEISEITRLKKSNLLFVSDTLIWIQDSPPSTPPPKKKKKKIHISNEIC